MFTQEEYFWAWMSYLIGASIFMIAFWVLSSNISRRAPRHISRICVAVFFLTPCYTDDKKDLLSPAWLVSMIEGFFEGPQAFWRAGTPLLIAVCLSFLCFSALYTILWLRRRGQ